MWSSFSAGNLSSPVKVSISMSRKVMLVEGSSDLWAARGISSLKQVWCSFSTVRFGIHLY